MVISLFQALILSIVQGITEWFPVSSSGHLALIQNFFGFQNLPFDVFLHLAGVFAVVVLLWRDITRLFKKENWKYLFYILIALIPAGLVGLFLRKTIENFFSNSLYIGIFFLLSGVFIYCTKFSYEKKKKISFFDSIFIGIFQAFAILPGISRSGATISSGLYRGINRENSVKFSFLLSIPIILGAGILEFGNMVSSEIDYFLLIISFVVTFLVSLITIKALFKIIKSDKFYLFGIYNIVLGLAVIIIHFLK